MIAYLKGEITFKSPTQVYIECSGVGYLVNISLQTYSKLEDKKKIKLFTHLYVREDAQILFGFFEEEEKAMFLLLISISGIGPNLGRLILSSMTTKELKKAIIYEEVSLIQTIKGIGPKSAKRLVLELKDKVTLEDDHLLPSGNTAYSDEALAALSMLGFPKQKSEQAIRRVLSSNPDVNSVEELIKMSLKNL